MSVKIETEWRTPTGRPRNVPMYSATIANTFLGTSRTFRGTNRASIGERAYVQLQKWSEQERRQRESTATRDALKRGEAEAASLDADARDTIAAVTTLLEATLAVNDQIDWEELHDRRVPDPFQFLEPVPTTPDATPRMPDVHYDAHPVEPWYSGFWPGARRRWKDSCAAVDATNARLHAEAQGTYQKELARCEQVKAGHEAVMRDWNQRQEVARRQYEAECLAFGEAQGEHNSRVDSFRKAFERGAPQAVEEYLRGVFERSDYPASFAVQHTVEFDGPTGNATVAIDVPALADFPSVSGYTFVKATRGAKAVAMKKREHSELYERAVAQTILRTLHEIFEADYASVVKGTEVSAFVSTLDPATGKDRRSCVAAVSTTREAFLALDLRRLDPVACVSSLSHAVMSSG